MMRILGSQALSTTNVPLVPVNGANPILTPKPGEFIYVVADAAWGIRINGATGTYPAGFISVAANVPFCIGFGNFNTEDFIVRATTGTPNLYCFATEVKI